MPPPISIVLAIFIKFSTTSILSLTFAPPRMATNGRAGFVTAFPRYASSFSIRKRLTLRFSIRANAVAGETYRPLEKLLQLLRHRRQRILRLRSALGPPQVRSQHQPPALLNRQPQRW